jgi:hypothetical protein
MLCLRQVIQCQCSYETQEKVDVDHETKKYQFYTARKGQARAAMMPCEARDTSSPARSGVSGCPSGIRQCRGANFFGSQRVGFLPIMFGFPHDISAP